MAIICTYIMLCCIYCNVPQVRLPFWNLSLSTKHRGDLYAGCDNFSRNYALPSSLLVGGGDQAWGVAECEVERCSRC